jgi:oligopeptide transport system permease protein
MSAGAGPTATPAQRPDAFNLGIPPSVRNEYPPGEQDPGYPPGRGATAPDRLWRRALAMPRVFVGGGTLLLVAVLCVGSMPWTLNIVGDASYHYDQADPMLSNAEPLEGGPIVGLFGFDLQGRSVLARCLLGGVVSLSVGLAAAAISVVLGCTVGLLAGYIGGKVDAALMRAVDVMYGLPYILLVIMFQVALRGPLERLLGVLDVFPSSAAAANLTVMFLAIGLVSWLTMARVVRGQVLSLRGQPFVEAARAAGISPVGIFFRHLLPNLVGPILVYATLTVPQAILQESFLSFLGIGVQPPLPSWGGLAAEGLRPAMGIVRSYWWQLLFPCLLLAVTLLSLNFLGDGLRDLFDPKRESAKL